MPSSCTAFRSRPRRYFIAWEGFPFIAVALFAAFAMGLAGLGIGAWVMIGIAGFVAYFFRNPERDVPTEEGLVVAPADGRILSVTPDVSAPHIALRSTKVSIFMSVLNVHINRFPVTAVVKKAVYSPGSFLVASLDKASERNERNSLVLCDDKGRMFVMVQIAGLIARRIICYMKEGDFLPRGERFGLIRFGSRVDLYLPPEVRVEVRTGEKARGGETVIGRFSS